MCQSRARGGRRCPSHRQDTKQLIRFAQDHSTRNGYGREVFHDLFVDLRRTYRGVEMNETQRTVLTGEINEFLYGEKYSDYGEEVADSATLQAQVKLRQVQDLIPSETEERMRTLLGSSLSEDESRMLFSYVYSHLDNYPEPSEEDLDVARSILGNSALSRLPSAVQALGVMNSGVLFKPREKITSEELASRISHYQDFYSLDEFSALGYAPSIDGQPSRLELRWTHPEEQNTPSLVFKNVDPETVYVLLSGSSNQARNVLTSIRNNPDCRYSSVEEARAEALSAESPENTVRCHYCGQYTGAQNHACPTIQIKPDILRMSDSFSYGANYNTAIKHTDQEGNALEQPTIDLSQMPEFVLPALEERGSDMDLDSLRRISGNTLLTDKFNKDNVTIQEIRLLHHVLRNQFISEGSVPQDYHEYDKVVYSGSPYDDNTECILYIPTSQRITVSATDEGLFLQHAGVSELPRRWKLVYPWIDTSTILYAEENHNGQQDSQDPIIDFGLSVYEQSTMFDSNAPEVTDDTKDKWHFPDLSEIHETLESNPVVGFNFIYESTVDTGGRFLDSHGEGYEPTGVSGEIKTRKINATLIVEKSVDGEVRIIGYDSARCSTCDYGPCSHQRHAINRLPKVLNETLKKNPAESPTPEGILHPVIRDACTVDTDSEGKTQITFRDESRRYPSLLGRFDDSEADEATKYALSAHTTAPHPRQILQGLKAVGNDGSVVIPVKSEFHHLYTSPVSTPNRSKSLVEGTVTLGKDDEGNPFVKERSLKCNCDVYQRNYSCRHTRLLENQAMGILDPITDQKELLKVKSGSESYSDARNLVDAITIQDRQEALREPIPDVREALEQADAERNLGYREREELMRQYGNVVFAERREAARLAELQELAAYTEQREKMKVRYQAFEGPRYSEDYKAFNAELKEVQKKIAAGEDPLTYETSNVLNGIGDENDYARKFGIELEVVFNDDERAYHSAEEDDHNFDEDDDSFYNEDYDPYADEDDFEASKDKVARDLAQAGLSDSEEVADYHSGQESGWEKWTAENDCTVDLEVVSPIMSDTTEGWGQLQRVCDIIKARGGTANRQTGSHVHISTGDYGKSVAAHAALLDEFSRYSDIFYRLGSNPQTKTHRGTRWCGPNVVTPGSVVNRQESENYANVSSYLDAPHASAINFEASGSGAKSHAEVRLWDGSLDPKVIQMQVMLTAAMTEVAAQNINKEDPDTFTYSSEPMPLGSSKNKSFQSKEEETFKFREMLDRYFPRESDRKRFIALWAVTKWQSD